MIKVLGIGGCGCNGITRLAAQGLDGVERIAIDTDAQALASAQCDGRILLGGGLADGTSGDPAAGAQAAESGRAAIAAALADADLAILLCGLGGGTGTGAAWKIAEMARGQGVPAVCVAHRPFLFEGRTRRRNSDLGAERIKARADACMFIDNDGILKMKPPAAGLTVSGAFELADRGVARLIKALAGLLDDRSDRRLDLAEVRSALTSGAELDVTGVSGDEADVVERLCSEALWRLAERPADSVLVRIEAGADVPEGVIGNIAFEIRECLPAPEAVKIGWARNRGAGDGVDITLIACRRGR